MPLINKNSSELNKYIEDAIELIGTPSVRAFGKDLSVERLEFIPEMATCQFAWVIACVCDILTMKDIKIISKKSKNPWTSAKAWTYGKNIYFNTRKSHTQSSVIKTILHELVHIADSSDDHSFGHGFGPMANFNQDKKQLCAPMLFANMFYEFMERASANR